MLMPSEMASLCPSTLRPEAESDDVQDAEDGDDEDEDRADASDSVRIGHHTPLQMLLLSLLVVDSCCCCLLLMMLLSWVYVCVTLS
jgi:hypothetical protein